MNKEADSLSLKAEETRNFNLIIKFNSHRKRSKDKEAEVEQIKTEIAEKESTNVNVMKKIKVIDFEPRCFDFIIIYFRQSKSNLLTDIF